MKIGYYLIIPYLLSFGIILYTSYITIQLYNKKNKYKNEISNANYIYSIYANKNGINNSRIMSEKYCTDQNCISKISNIPAATKNDTLNTCSKLSDEFKNHKAKEMYFKLRMIMDLCSVDFRYCGSHANKYLELFNKLKKDGSDRFKCYVKFEENIPVPEEVKNFILLKYGKK